MKRNIPHNIVAKKSKKSTKKELDNRISKLEENLVLLKKEFAELKAQWDYCLTNFEHIQQINSFIQEEEKRTIDFLVAYTSTVTNQQEKSNFAALQNQPSELTKGSLTPIKLSPPSSPMS